MPRGLFITLEGSEGAGKSTLARALADGLRAQGRRVVLTREPGGTAAGEQLRGVLLHHEGEQLSPIAESLLMFAARALHLDNVIRPALARGECVLCDRFSDASYAYQGGGRGVSTALLDQLVTAVHPGLWPDCTLLLDLPVAVGLSRSRARGLSDRFEQEQESFFERVRQTYRLRAAAEPQRFRALDATLAPGELLQAAQTAVQPFLIRSGDAHG